MIFSFLNFNFLATSHNSSAENNTSVLQMTVVKLQKNKTSIYRFKIIYFCAKFNRNSVCFYPITINIMYIK